MTVIEIDSSGLRRLEAEASEFDVISIGGVSVSVEMFEFFADLANTGKFFQFVSRDGAQVAIRSFAPGTTIQEPQ